MKPLQLLLLSFFVLITVSFSKCKKDTDEPQLPSETTSGAMTFGCKVNGKVFVPRDSRGHPGLFCQYVYNGANLGGGWFLNIPATNWVPNPPEGVNIETDSLLVEEGKTYTLKKVKGHSSAYYDDGSEYNTIGDNAGELKITKFDQVKRILSGTFFFTGTNTSTGEKVSITEGRFDILF